MLTHALQAAINAELIEVNEHHDVYRCDWNWRNFWSLIGKWLRIVPQRQGLPSKITAENFRIVWNSFIGKTSSLPEDMHGVMANLLGLNATELLSVPMGDRCKAIIASSSQLPIGLLFDCPATCTLTAAGSQSAEVSWVPRFPGEKGRLYWPDHELLVTPHGLSIKQRGFADGGDLILIGTTCSDLDDAKVLAIDVQVTDNESTSRQRHFHVEMMASPQTRLSSIQQGRLCFLLEKGKTSPRWSRGACFTMIGSDDHSIYTHFRCPVKYQEVPYQGHAASENNLEGVWSTGDPELKHRDMLVACGKP